MSFKRKDVYIHNIFSTVAPHLDLLTSSFSFGFDQIWRKLAVSRSGIRKGDQVLDVCCGTGKLAFLLSKRVGPGGSVTGTDYCEEMLELAKVRQGSRYQNVSFSFSDAKNILFPDNMFDAVTVAYGIRNIPDTSVALTEINRVLKPGGKFICLELTKPHASWFRVPYEWYVFKVMPFIAMLVTKKAKPYLYLPRSIKAFYSPDELKQLIATCGFTDITFDSLTMGIATITKAVKKGEGLPAA
jgi:demethylmenaquinone methyltransferase/2-methoxy-6-polyprenyl-1,4-benzoquinol methylase